MQLAAEAQAVPALGSSAGPLPLAVRAGSQIHWPLVARAAAPKTKIVGVGYLLYVEEADCGATISKAEAKLIRSAIDRMNDVIKELAMLNVTVHAP